VVVRTKVYHKSSFGDPKANKFSKTQIIIGDNGSQEMAGSTFLTQDPFQALLELLGDPRFKKVTLWIETMLHLHSWCQTHEQNDEIECSIYRGYMRLLKEDSEPNTPVLELDWRRVVEAFLGLRC
jgi:hypothetical protein